jgi:predicted AAA+ superfamily ATPase
MSKLTLPPYRRPAAAELAARLNEPRRFIQVIAGPRQVGKTTLARQVLASSGIAYRYASADEPTLRGRPWLEEQWDAARLLTKQSKESEAILILDEVQKISGWSETVKRLWDEDTAVGRPLKVVLLGSAPLLIQRGLTESLAGRFEVLHISHWSYVKMQAAFGWDLDRYIFYGGYPGAAPLIGDHSRWSRYILDSLIETTISRDVLLLTRVDKPALLRRLFELACSYSGQVLSYTKMLGQLQDAGNTTTLAHYLDLLTGAGMVTGLQKYAKGTVRRRGSSPKLQVMNTALMTAPSGLTLSDAQADRNYWGRLVESAVGAHLVNAQSAGEYRVFYWRVGAHEVDFVVETARSLVAIEVKSGRVRKSLSGIAEFDRRFHPTRKLLVGDDGIPIDEFLSKPVLYWVGS